MLKVRDNIFSHFLFIIYPISFINHFIVFILITNRKTEYDIAGVDGSPVPAIMAADNQENSGKLGDKKSFRINAKDASNRELVTRQVGSSHCV